MPRYSVLIPAYNAEPYIAACLNSVTSQGIHDLEIVIVDDGSTDNTRSIIRHMASKDQRIRLVSKDQNEGRHMARKTAALSSQGKFILFLDADDELAPRTLDMLDCFIKDKQFDMVRYGLTAVPETPEDRAIAFDYESLFNGSDGDLRGTDAIVRASFSREMPQWVSWNIHTTLYRGDMVREAFADMEDMRIDKLQDTLEYLAIAIRANVMYDLTTLRGLRYHVGRGITSRAQMPVADFLKGQSAVHDTALAAQRFAQQHESPLVECAVQFLYSEAISIVYDDFRLRVVRNDQSKAMSGIAHTWGREVAAKMLIDLLNSQVNWYDTNDTYPPEDGTINEWWHLYQVIRPEHYSDLILVNKAASLEAMFDRFAKRQQAEIKRHAREEREARQREEEAREAHRLFKKGTVARRVTDRLFPETGRARRVIRAILTALRAS